MKVNQCLAGVFKVISQLFETRIVRILEILRLSHRQKLKTFFRGNYPVEMLTKPFLTIFSRKSLK